MGHRRVNSFAALHAPFLITSNTLLSKVAEPAIADEMLAGLDKVGVSGLAMFPEGLRLLFSFDSPVLKPSDLAGKSVRAPRSNTTYALLHALGATPDDLPGDLFTDGIAAGKVVAAESSFALARHLPWPTVAAANLVLYPKMNTLVANTKMFQDLGETQRQSRKDAAAATSTWASKAMTAPADDAAACCLNGGTVVMAAAADVAAFREAGADVYSKLETDSDTKTRIARIRDLAAADPEPSDVPPCSPGG